MTFTKGTCKIVADGKVLGAGQKYEQLFGVKVVLPNRVCLAEVKPLDDYYLQLWHQRMGHISKDSISNLQDLAEGVNPIKKVSHCVSCAQGKQRRNPFPSSSSHPEEISKIVHSYIMGPF